MLPLFQPAFQIKNLWQMRLLVALLAKWWSLERSFPLVSCANGRVSVWWLGSFSRLSSWVLVVSRLRAITALPLSDEHCSPRPLPSWHLRPLAQVSFQYLSSHQPIVGDVQLGHSHPICIHILTVHVKPLLCFEPWLKRRIVSACFQVYSWVDRHQPVVYWQKAIAISCCTCPTDQPRQIGLRKLSEQLPLYLCTTLAIWDRTRPNDRSFQISCWNKLDRYGQERAFGDVTTLNKLNDGNIVGVIWGLLDISTTKWPSSVALSLYD